MKEINYADKHHKDIYYLSQEYPDLTEETCRWSLSAKLKKAGRR